VGQAPRFDVASSQHSADTVEYSPDKRQEGNSVWFIVWFIYMWMVVEGSVDLLVIVSKVYCKPTHTNLCLNAKSHHHPSNKQAILSTLICRARALSDEDRLQAELVFQRGVFKHNDYNDQQIHRALK
jgi:hypothetical protein